MIKVFTPGFLGGSATDSSIWFGERVQGAKEICVPFTGAAKHVSAMAQPDCNIDCWDTQIISRAFVEGVLGNTTPDNCRVSNLEGTPRYQKGYMYDQRTFKGIDERCAGFIDWVGANGTLFDIAAIASATGRSTFRGRMEEWTATIEEFWARFQTARMYMRPFVNFYPGTFRAFEADFYKATEWKDKHYDVLQVDPPKIISTTDIYSAKFGGINKALGGTVEMDRWSWRDYVGRLRGVLQVDSDVIAFQYCSDVRPDLNTIKSVLTDYGKIVDEATFPHRTKFDYTLMVERS